MKIVTIVGARPQFIKAATVSRAIAAHIDRIDDQRIADDSKRLETLNEVIIHTGQHYDENMSQVFFEELEIPKPHYNLGIGGGTHGRNTGRMIEGTEAVLLNEKPDWVLVYGDTDSTLAGALAAVKLHIPVAHVEAGLRSFNRRMPEEINRILTDHASDLLFPPTETAVRNLSQEGVSGSAVCKVGDVMYDAAMFYAAKALKKSHILERLNVVSEKYLLVTVHRAENTDSPQKLTIIMNALNLIAIDIPVILPLHPRTKNKLRALDLIPHKSLIMIDPVGYLDMVMLEKNAAAIATDSGGVQKEAFFHQVPCVTLRAETEWVELLQLGWNRLAKPDSVDAIISGVNACVTSTPVLDENPYGTGESASLIVNRLIKS